MRYLKWLVTTLTVTMIVGLVVLIAVVVMRLNETPGQSFPDQIALPDGATGFITLELKANLLRSAAVGDHLLCTATPTHRGRRTHVWDAAVTLDDITKPLALFRCTQLIL